ncbi:tigger transposable element-derived protein 1-like [Chiloscyllium plagiosum]|uniref:tigger transposable element-derived protein 1-like n=1 Tax=Chiloscyllium plagiosum TaxID=36176 RepID=UPI001CB7E118|nr:tigger transposable element-derived protein 1-like [Chiloscyllium plagiosum]XP_043557072.1 tigger transposable element-derived protein 1-like [Chiloscyllium plagiosum]XP_043557073.1 tigger transposable element-derived protein 1-like [Chiloscyllium plagiosum]
MNERITLRDPQDTACFQPEGEQRHAVIWNKLCPQFADGFKEFTPEGITKARQAVADIGNNQLQLDINEGDVVDLLESHAEELTNEELMELEQQMIAFEEEGRVLETPEPNRFLTKELAEAFHLIETGMAKLEEQDPNIERFTKIYRTFTNGLSCCKAIYNEKKKSSVQATLNVYFKKLTSEINLHSPAAESDPDSSLTVSIPDSAPGPSSN